MKGRFSRWTAALLCVALFCTMLPAAWATNTGMIYKAQEAVGPSDIVTPLSKKWTSSSDLVEGEIQSISANQEIVFVGTSANAMFALNTSDGKAYQIPAAEEDEDTDSSEDTEDTDDTEEQPEMENWSAAECYGTACYATDAYILCQRTNGALTAFSIEDKLVSSEKGISGTICTPFVRKDNNLYFATTEAIYGATIGVDGGLAVEKLIDATSKCAPAVTDSGLYFVKSDGVYYFDGSQAERIYEASVSGTTSVQVSGDTILFLNGGKIIPLQSEEEAPETVVPEITDIKVQRDKNDQTKATVTFTTNCEGTVYYAIADTEPDVFAGKKTQKVTEGKNTLSLTGLSKSEQTLWLGLMANDEEKTKSDIISVTIAKGTEEQVVTPEKEKKISGISAKRTVKYTNKKDADVSKITVTFTTNFSGTVYYTTSESLAKSIKKLGEKKSVSEGKNTINISNSSDETLWIGYEDKNGDIQTKKVDLDPPTVYTARLTMNPTNAKLTVKYDGTTLSPQKSVSKSGQYYYQFVVGEKYQVIAKVPNSKKYKEINQSVTISKKSNFTVNVSRGDGRLSNMILNTNQTNLKNSQLALSPSFSSNTEEYTAELSGTSNTAYLWLKPRKDSTKLTVKIGSKTLKASSYSGYQRYAISFDDDTTKHKIRITATGADDTENTYTVTVQRAEKFALSLVRDLTGRTGASTLTLTIYSPRAGTGYLKVVNPGVDVTAKELFSDGIKFSVKKGNTMLKISGLAAIARDIYIGAEDANGERTSRLKISISAYSGTDSSTRTRPSSLTSGTWISSSSSSNGILPSDDGSDFYNINASSWANGDGTDSGDSTESGSELLNTFDEGLDALEGSDGTTVDIDVGSEAGTQGSVEQIDVGSSANGTVPSNSILSGGIPIWGIVLILAVVAGGGFAIYWFVIRLRRKREKE